MRRAGGIAAALLALAMPASGYELHVLGGVDFFGANSSDITACTGILNPNSAPKATPAGCTFSNGPAVEQLGVSLRLDARNLGGRYDLHLFYQGSTDFGGGSVSSAQAGAGLTAQPSAPTRSDLYDLSFTAHDLGGRVDLTLGRFATPGGFWLIVDGGQARVRIVHGLSLQVYGGLRAFTTGRVETHLTSDPIALPLVGAAATYDHPLLHATLAFTWTRDDLAFHRGWQTTDVVSGASTQSAGEHVVDENTQGKQLIEDEMFLVAQLLAFPHPKLTVGGSVTFANRYDMTLSGAYGTSYFDRYGIANLSVATLGSFDAHVFLEYHPLRILRIAYLFDFDRVRIDQPSLLSSTTAGTPTAAAGGSFEDHTLKASLRPWRALRFDARYRLRFRETTDVIHRVEGALYGDQLVVGLGAFFIFGVDEYQTYANTVFHQKGTDPSRAYVEGGLSYINQLLDLRGGVLYTDYVDAVKNAVPLSASLPLAGTPPSPTSQLFPLVLEAQRIAFLRGFFHYHGFFAGVDAEINLDASQFRLLAQAGYGR